MNSNQHTATLAYVASHSETTTFLLLLSSLPIQQASAVC